jgi:TRAP-type C4-dicarboxylate transport system substrate-binding protein
MAAYAKPIELRAVAAWPTHLKQVYWFHEYIKEVNTRAEKNGLSFKIKKLGGPEVFGTREQFGAIRSGAVDMAYTAGEYFDGETVELTSIYTIRPDPLYYLNALRETKVMDVVNEASREKSGVISIFSTLFGRGFTLLSTRSFNPGDWSGMKIRGGGTFSSTAIKRMGGSPVSMPGGEVFEALQRGIVDAVWGTSADRYAFGERGIYKYILMPRVSFQTTHFYLSAKVWDQLPDNIKTFLKGVSHDLEPKSVLWCRQWDDETVLKYIDEDGIKLLWCSPEQERKIGKAFREDWLELAIKKSPKYGPRIHELLKDHLY